MLNHEHIRHGSRSLIWFACDTFRIRSRSATHSTVKFSQDLSFHPFCKVSTCPSEMGVAISEGLSSLSHFHLFVTNVILYDTT